MVKLLPGESTRLSALNKVPPVTVRAVVLPTENTLCCPKTMDELVTHKIKNATTFIGLDLKLFIVQNAFHQQNMYSIFFACPTSI